ncbi:hypothetical protein I4F81_005138 [Pyropia yezoensis]|uniref:Uncharacterized protein n=1 Tax=Pyropia yezoensis TaxID=2788 RepID=A0ACC3BXE5_PYRYE|nr:hypothetical protein I4F81_005138 [Neopyropia yezoensis]
MRGNYGGDFSDVFPTDASFVAGLRGEQNRILSKLKWMKAPIEVGGKTYTFYFRDLLDVAVNAVRMAEYLDLEGGRLPPAADGSPRRSTTLNADMFVNEVRAVQSLHCQRARPLFASLHADAAVVSWSGTAYVYPVGAQFPSLRDDGSRWVTVGYIPHIPKAVSRTDKAKLEVSDSRTGFLQRCVALILRRVSRASETGYPVAIPGVGTVLLVARVGGIVVDFIEERSLYALMGSGSTIICSLCRVHHSTSCAAGSPRANPRNVVETLAAQLAAAEVRVVDPRVSLRGPLAKAHSALAFAPVLASMQGLSTGSMNYIRVVSFDLLHVWKISILCTVAQRLPWFLRAICTKSGGATMGSVRQTLDALNHQGFELGRRCRAKPASPGCFVPPEEKQAAMTGHSWRQFSVFWPHTVAGLICPADPDGLKSFQADLSAVSAYGPVSADLDDGLGLEDDEDAHQAVPAGVATGDGTAYQSLFGDMPVQDAVQKMFCQIAQLEGMLCGDNMADTVHTTGTQASALLDAAFCVGRSIQVLLRPAHTSGLHRLMWHLRNELEGRGNLWEGDTSRNESLRKVCKKMCLRSNKRGPTLAVQMMRGEQAQTEILHGLTGRETDDEAVSEDEERVEQVNAMHAVRLDDRDAVPDSVLHMSTRGVRIAVGVLSALPGLQDLPTLLEMDVAETVVGAKTLKFNAKFEWGTQSRIQLLRATTSFNAKPYLDHLRYKADNGESVWPTVELIDAARVLRLESIVPDWRALEKRCGVHATPSKKPHTPDEFRQERFFVNVFYPWTSRRAVGDD